MKRLLNAFYPYSHHHDLITSGDSILVALSGGPDSVALLKLLTMIRQTQKLKLACLHVNHELRRSADRDERFVRKICTAWNVPCYVKRQNVRRVAQQKKLSLEEAGREVRYRVLIKKARELKFRKIATAHTRDDQAETVMMRILRGAGLKGIAAVPVKRQEEGRLIIRPLLGVSKKSILAALKRAKISYVRDPSNEDDVYFRNRIRKNLLPKIEKEYSRGISDRLAALADDAQALYGYLAHEAQKRYRTLSKRHGKTLSLPVRQLRSLHPVIQTEVLFQAIEEVQGNRRRLTRKHLHAIQGLLKGPNKAASLTLPQRLKAQRDRERLILKKS